MNRETNREIISIREKLRSGYHEWAMLKKSGKEHLPRSPTEEDKERIKKRMRDEIINISLLQTCCESLTVELEKDIELIINGD